MFRILFFAAISLPVFAQAPTYGYTVVKAYPHDTSAFTQGLEYVDGFLYEGTGMKGQSSIRKVDLETGQVLRKMDVDANFFGEGITVFGNQLVELTWQSKTGFVYDKATFRMQRSFGYSQEGWGLTHDSKQLIMSDGTSTLHFWEPKEFRELRKITVHDGKTEIDHLNELEYIDGEIYANIWETDRIARISPADGHVIAWIDLSGILSQSDRIKNNVDVLNGIAWDAKGKRLFVTGKWWPKLFEIKLVKK